MARRIPPKTFVSNTTQVNVWGANQQYKDCVKLQFGTTQDVSLFWKNACCSDTFRIHIGTVVDCQGGSGFGIWEGHLTVESLNAMNNNVNKAFGLSHSTTGCPANNIGIGTDYFVETSTCAAGAQIGQIDFRWTNVTHACREAAYRAIVFDAAGSVSAFEYTTSDDTFLLPQGRLKFPACANFSTDVNTLDDYQEGSFTPTIGDDSLNECENQTYFQQFGAYVKIGKWLFFHLRVGIDSLGCLTTSQGVNIMGFPFAVKDVTSGESALTVGFGASLAITAGETVAGFNNKGLTYAQMHLWDSCSGTSVFTVAELSTGGILMVNGHYQVC